MVALANGENLGSAECFKGRNIVSPVYARVPGSAEVGNESLRFVSNTAESPRRIVSHDTVNIEI